MIDLGLLINLALQYMSGKYVSKYEHICYAFFGFAVLFLMSSCGGGDSSSNPELMIDPPQLLLSDPVDGSKNLSDGDLTIVLTFDQNVTSPSFTHSLVTVGNATVILVSAALKNVTIKLSSLQKGKTYELIVPKGVVLGPTKLEAPLVKISFSIMDEVVHEPIVETLCTFDPLPQAKKVYDYLINVYGKKTLSASMANVNWNIAEAELVNKATGKYPAIAFLDYIHLYASPANWIDYSNTRVVENWWDKGGLIGASWHWVVPNVENGNEYTYKPGNGNKDNEGNWTTTFRAKNAIIEGTWENRIMKADLEKIAGYLKLLKNKNIPVIWRPLHEAAGNLYEYSGGTAWFWWGYDGPEVYKKVWIYMFNYFKEQGVNNLIWVWTTQMRDADFYPGDEYVDIISRDIYDQKTGANNAEQYNLIVAKYSRKLIALSECGNVAMISAQWNAGAHWSFFMPWYRYNATTLDGHEYADTSWWKDAMEQSFVVTRDQLPSMK